MKKLILLSLLVSPLAQSSVLPHVFYAPTKIKTEICNNPAFKNENFWRGMMANRMDQLTRGKSETAKNSFVTKSYLELYKLTSSMNGPKFMGYIYTNASNHLGRLVRYNKWPDGHPLKNWDLSFVEGQHLRGLAQSTNYLLSPMLMKHSVNLYKEIAWPLASASMCGMNYTKAIVKDKNLIKAFESKALSDFVRHYVTFEQTYLQSAMYEEFLIKLSAKSTVLDQMRYMPFNGQKQTNFYEWCEEVRCGTSSYDLVNRVRYDVWSISTELFSTHANESVLNERLKNSRINEILAVFMK